MNTKNFALFTSFAINGLLLAILLILTVVYKQKLNEQESLISTLSNRKSLSEITLIQDGKKLEPMSCLFSVPGYGSDNAKPALLILDKGSVVCSAMNIVPFQSLSQSQKKDANAFSRHQTNR